MFGISTDFSLIQLGHCHASPVNLCVKQLTKMMFH